jgi:hypothetical protein
MLRLGMASLVRAGPKPALLWLKNLPDMCGSSMLVAMMGCGDDAVCFG